MPHDDQQSSQEALFAALLGGRPWRKWGVIACAVIGFMFVLGAIITPERMSPLGFGVYWLMVLALVLVVCALAAWDMLNTRRALRLFERATAARQRSGGKGMTDDFP